MHSRSHDSDNDSYDALKHINKRSTRNLTSLKTSGPVSETARWMIGAEPSYDDILREKKRVEAELKWKMTTTRRLISIRKCTISF